MSKRFWILAIALAGLLVVAMACDDDEKTTEELEAEACADLAEFALSLEALGTVLQDPNATVGEAQEALDATRSARDTAKDSVEKVGEARFSDVESAYQALDDSVKDIPDDATLQQGLASIQDNVAAVILAEANLESQLCDVGAPGALPEPTVGETEEPDGEPTEEPTVEPTASGELAPTATHTP